METTKIKMNMDGTIRAKVLQYKSDGNTLIEKWETLKKYTEGVYYNLTPDNYGGEYCNIILEINGVFWKNNITPGNVFCAGHYAHKRWDNEARTVVATFPDIVRKNSKLGKYINNMQIEVMRRLGHDVAELQASHDEYIRQREERDRQRAEEAERRERERMEAEERRKAEVLADGKKKLLKHERISVEQIELIAEAVGYKINIRTIGFMREKVTRAAMSDNGVQVSGYKLTSRNIDGTAKVMHEIYDRIKAQVEEEAEQPAAPTETPQISTEVAETTELSAEATKAEEAPKYSISERDGNVYVTFKRCVIRQCAKRCGVSCKSAEWNTIAQAYNGTYSDMGMGLSFFFDGREDAVRFAELVCNGDISGYYKLYMDKIIAEGEARKKRIAEKCAEYDAAQAYFAECMADEDAETVNVSVEAENAAETKENCHSDTRIVSDGYGTQYEVTRHWKNGRVESLDVIVLDTQPQTAKEPPQSPETPQTVECTTDTPKPRETARKPQNRGIGNTRHSRLGANGYAMLDNASATLTAMHVPRECSTADAAYW